MWLVLVLASFLFAGFVMNPGKPQPPFPGCIGHGCTADRPPAGSLTTIYVVDDKGTADDDGCGGPPDVCQLQEAIDERLQDWLANPNSYGIIACNTSGLYAPPNNGDFLPGLLYLPSRTYLACTVAPGTFVIKNVTMTKYTLDVGTPENRVSTHSVIVQGVRHRHDVMDGTGYRNWLKGSGVANICEPMDVACCLGDLDNCWLQGGATMRGIDLSDRRDTRSIHDHVSVQFYGDEGVDGTCGFPGASDLSLTNFIVSSGYDGNAENHPTFPKVNIQGEDAKGSRWSTSEGANPWGYPLRCGPLTMARGLFAHSTYRSPKFFRLRGEVRNVVNYNQRANGFEWADEVSNTGRGSQLVDGPATSVDIRDGEVRFGAGETGNCSITTTKRCMNDGHCTGGAGTCVNKNLDRFMGRCVADPSLACNIGQDPWGPHGDDCPGPDTNASCTRDIPIAYALRVENDSHAGSMFIDGQSHLWHDGTTWQMVNPGTPALLGDPQWEFVGDGHTSPSSHDRRGVWYNNRRHHPQWESKYPPPTIPVGGVGYVWNEIKSDIGAICPTRDGIDQDVVNSVDNGTDIPTSSTPTVTVPSNGRFAEPEPAPATKWVDADRDGLSDAWEMHHFGNFAEAGNGDTDGDGFINFTEQANNTDPNEDTPWDEPFECPENLF
jgi:hypothetical protein